jgi:hypothetical protein
MRGDKGSLLAASGRLLSLSLGLSLGLALGLGGCASSGMFAKLPEAVGGEPADAPARSTSDYQFPAVHDMPPARATEPMSGTDQVKMEKDLQKARDELEAKSGDIDEAAPAKKAEQTKKKDQTKKKPQVAAKKPPLDIKNGQATGTAPNP